MNESGFNSALTVNQPLDFNNWAAFNGRNSGNPNSLLANIGNWFTGYVDKDKQDYEMYLANQDKLWELAKINDARAWEEYMSNTAFSRQMKDIENAGYNPLLALTGGAGSGASTPASPSGSSATSYRKSNNFGDTNQMGDIGELLGSALRLAGFAIMSSGHIIGTSMKTASNEKINAQRIRHLSSSTNIRRNKDGSITKIKIR